MSRQSAVSKWEGLQFAMRGYLVCCAIPVTASLSKRFFRSFCKMLMNQEVKQQWSGKFLIISGPTLGASPIAENLTYLLA